MNFRTTLFLAVCLAALVLAFFLIRSGPTPVETDIASTMPMGASTIAQEAIKEELGDIVKVVVQRAGQDDWVFEKQLDEDGAPTDKWRMTSPQEMDVVRWEVERIGRQLSTLQYEVSYQPGESGSVSAVEAGLEPPEATVLLTDVDATEVSIEIGKSASADSTYVRVPGAEAILVGKSSLRDLIKPKTLDYRDKALWSFKPGDVTRVEVVDRSGDGKPVTFAFGLEGKRWMMEAPVTARATSKVDEMLQGMSRLRASKWHDDRPERLAAYGLEPANLSVRVTVEEEIEVAAAEDKGGSADVGGGADESAEEKPEVETETKVAVYELHVSSRAPIGEDTKAYIRVGQESAVGTIMKTIADKLKPEMSEWRDMRITTANVSMATRIELAASAGAATFVKGDAGWTFEDDGEVAERAAVEALLGAVRDLKAVAFIDGPPDDLVAFGLDQPQADIKLTIPGVEDPECIAVGGYTDARTKRLVYVRRNEIASVAKVRAPEVAALTRGLRAYRDRTVFAVPADQIVEIALSAKNQFGEGRTNVTLTRADEAWSMSSPVEAPARDKQLRRLAEVVADLRAESVVGDGEELSAYGLDDPAVTVTFKPGLEADLLELAVSEHAGKVYAKRGDHGSIYELTHSFHGQLLAEYRAREVLTFDDSTVPQFSICSGGVTHAFARAGEGWTYGTEPDLPLDPRKVTNLLLQLRDLRTEQFLDHATTELSPWGLTVPEHEVTVALQDGSNVALLVSKQVCPDDSQGRYYAAVRGQPGVFLMSPDTIGRFAVSLDELEASP